MTTPDGLPPTPPPFGPRPAPLTIASVVSLVVAAALGGIQFLAPGVASKVPSSLGTVASWISAGGIMGILSLLVWLQLGNRKLGVEQRNLDRVDGADLRDHYAEELASLRQRLDEQSARHSKALTDVEDRYLALLHETEAHYKTLLRESDEAHERCKNDREVLRAEVDRFRSELDGLRRQIVTQGTDRVLALGSTGSSPSEAVTAAAHRVKRRLDDGADKKPRH